MSVALYMNLWLKSGNDHHSVMQVIKPAAAELWCRGLAESKALCCAVRL